VLAFLKERFPLLSEAEIMKMALSKLYHQEAAEGRAGGETDHTQKERFTPEEWEKGFVLMDKMRANTQKFKPQDLEDAIEEAIKDVRQKHRV
jgi:hypothetical protein